MRFGVLILMSSVVERGAGGGERGEDEGGLWIGAGALGMAFWPFLRGGSRDEDC